MALLSLDRHDVLETIRQSNSLHEAFLRIAKLPAVGEYRTATNADRIRSMTDEEMAELFMQEYDGADSFTCPVPHPCPPEKEASCRECLLDWLKEEAKDD